MGFDFDYAEKTAIVNKTTESDPIDFPNSYHYEEKTKETLHLAKFNQIII